MTKAELQKLKEQITGKQEYMVVEVNDEGDYIGEPFFGSTEQEAIDELESYCNKDEIGDSNFILVKLNPDIKRIVVKETINDELDPDSDDDDDDDDDDDGLEIVIKDF